MTTKQIGEADQAAAEQHQYTWFGKYRRASNRWLRERIGSYQQKQ